jgi:hypothetical protein
MTRLLLFSLVLTFASGVAYGTRNSGFTEAELSASPVFGLQANQSNGIYRFSKDIEVLPKAELVKGLYIVDPDRHTVGFTQGEPVTAEFLASGDVAISIVLPVKEQGVMPEKIILSEKEFLRSGLTFVAQGTFAELEASYFSYDQFQEARRGGGGFARGGRAHFRNAAGGSYYGCVAYVCRAIGGCSGSVGNGVGMTNYLRARGWKPVSCSNPPIGAVASWSGGGGAGHTGIWNGSGFCYDLGCGNPGRNYRLKPPCMARR